MSHHHHKLVRLTGMDMEGNQAQRLLDDIQTSYTASGRSNPSLELSAHEWLNTVFELVIAVVPPEFAGRLELTQIYHELLEHRWYLAESAGRDIPLDEVAASYVENVLAAERDEVLYIISESDTENPTPVADPDLW